MNFQKKLINLFRVFTEKVFIPLCNKNQLILNDWNKFLALLSVDNININELQLYVDSISNNNYTNPLIIQSQLSPPTLPKKEDFYSSMYNRNKKQQNSSIDNNQELTFNPNKTFGGEKIKLPSYTTKQQFEQMTRKQYNNSIGQTNKEELSKFRATTGNIGAVYKETTMDNAPMMLASLQKLYKSLVENQQKIQNLTQVSGAIANPNYF